ncbi:TlpA disulfide reductase family protein [Mucilaginibacter sp.]|jgi:thiol-disulfide isomerase/thioredoxin|uniref:TlpA family protein disulfide reductase n=1 Tax=Mucilaginibacter sp. TaxID=1882438 RepID=UPI002C13645F|nr:TlpA disulfide reductase family protein [Mucilaginibacter sp.]HTI58988.1 TlpA disulfide reductase family protein [Mucilaginibacter sp.]
MKLKIRFPGRLLPFRKQTENITDNPPVRRERIEKRYIVGLLLLWLIVFLFSMLRCDAKALKRLDTGSTLREVHFSHLINYPKTTASLNDFKDKLVIVNFWATWCGACIHALPKVNDLQQEFRDRVVILSVTKEKEETIKKFLAHDPWYANFQGILVTDDQLFSKLFPYSYLPHIVVIRNGKFYQQWDEDNLNAKNIRSILNGADPELVQKQDLIRFSLDSPLFKIHGNQLSSGTTYSMVITGHQPGLPLTGKETMDSLHGSARYDLINHLPANLYSIAMNSPLPHTANRRLILVKDSDKFLYHPYAGVRSDWERKNEVTYERTFPSGTAHTAFQQQLRNDLDFYFGWKSSIQEREVQGFILVYTGTGAHHDPLKKAEAYIDPEKKIHYLHGTGIEALLRLLNQFDGMPPVVDGTQLKTTFDIDFSKPPATIKDWQQALKASGFLLKPAILRLPMFVLTDSNDKISSQ